jgi:crotonobetainyl-CoA:carnitine CoA-transferase CaiB-like acyl-CoA transferase
MRALEGLKVLDFFWVAVGPMTTGYLAEYGATVVRVESRRRPDPLRSAPPFRDGRQGPNRSGYYAAYNANKYALGLNMGHPRALGVVRRLVGWADVVTENFTPGTMTRWGLGYEDLCRIKPDIVMLSTSMLGHGGPLSRQPGFGPVLSSLSGMTGVTGWPDRTPTNPYGAYTDFIVPRFAVPALIAALDYRRRTGRGQHLDISQLEAALHFIAPLLLDHAHNGREPARMGNRDPAAAPHGAFPCQGEDRWCTIACTTDAEWRALCRVMGEPSWTRDERFATLLGRKAHENELERRLGEWTGGWDAHALMGALQQAGVPAGVVENAREVLEDPQLAHRGHFIAMEHPDLGPHPVQRSEFRLSGEPGEHHWPAPNIGQHTVEVCEKFLGMAREEIDALVAEDILEVDPRA